MLGAWTRHEICVPVDVQTVDGTARPHECFVHLPGHMTTDVYSDNLEDVHNVRVQDVEDELVQRQTRL